LPAIVYAKWQREMINVFKIVVGKLEEKRQDSLEDVGVCERTILKWTLKKSSGRVWTVFVWLKIGTIGRLL
jgi:hypothetical protein